jgi:hypothetical protein
MNKLAVVVQEGKKWLVKTEDESRTLGTHDNAKDAYAQLYAIEKSKERQQKKSHKGMHDWPAEDDVDSLVQHLADHHQNTFKHKVSVIRDELAKANIHEDQHEDIIKQILPQLIKDSLNDGETSHPLLLTVHDHVHGRLNGPDRGIDIQTDPEKMNKIRLEVAADHRHPDELNIPEALPHNFSSKNGSKTFNSRYAIANEHEFDKAMGKDKNLMHRTFLDIYAEKLDDHQRANGLLRRGIINSFDPQKKDMMREAIDKHDHASNLIDKIVGMHFKNEDPGDLEDQYHAVAKDAFDSTKYLV